MFVRKSLLSCLTGTALLLALPVAGNAQLALDEAVFVSNSGGQMHLIDAPTGTILSSIPIASDSLDVDVTCDGTTALVTSFIDQSLSFVDLTASPPALNATIPVFFSAEDVSITCGSDDIALITDGGGGNTPVVRSVNISTMTIVDSLALDAQGVDVSPDGTRALVTSFDQSAIYVVSISPTGGLSLLQALSPPSGSPLNVTYFPNGNRAISDGFFTSSVDIWDTSGAVVSHAGSLALGGTAQSVTVSQDGTRAYVYLTSGEVAVLDIDGFDNVTDSGVRIAVPMGINYFGVDQVALTPDGALLLVRSANNVRVIDTATMTVLSDTPVSNDSLPGGIATLSNQPPSADCTFAAASGAPPNSPGVFECESSAGTAIVLDGSGSTDPDGDSLTHTWTIGSTTLSGAVVTYTFPAGVGAVQATLTVEDGRGGVDACTVSIAVEDTTPPTVSCATDVDMLWPPNHKLRIVDLTIEGMDACTDPSQIQIQSIEVTSDEADDDPSSGDGSTTGDVNGEDAGPGMPAAQLAIPTYDDSTGNFSTSLELRAERDGNLDGRVYTIMVIAIDDMGNSATTTCDVVVPKSQAGGN